MAVPWVHTSFAGASTHAISVKLRRLHVRQLGAALHPYLQSQPLSLQPWETEDQQGVIWADEGIDNLTAQVE
jgi:hypothetical protein